jgi:hypothetical protein
MVELFLSLFVTDTVVDETENKVAILSSTFYIRSQGETTPSKAGINMTTQQAIHTQSLETVDTRNSL